MSNPGLERLRSYLDQQGVEYETIHHKADFRAMATAVDTHTDPAEFAKTVFLWVDGHPIMAVLPASRHVALAKVRKALGAEHVRVATESDCRELCQDCEVGAAPPFGSLYDLPVYLSPALAEDETITFNAGTHRDAIRMRYADYERLVHPNVQPIAKNDG